MYKIYIPLLLDEKVMKWYCVNICHPGVMIMYTKIASFLLGTV